MLKNEYFLKNTVKNRLSVLLGALPPDPRVFTPAYYYSFVEVISSAKCVYYPSKRTK